jgi:choline dehydrogenase-like flavoprotein
MNSPAYSQDTAFARDVVGRFVCNGLDEALASSNQVQRPDARPFDVVIIGGGTFGSALASALFERDKTKKHRVLVLEAGPFALTEHFQNIPMPGLGAADPIHLATIQGWQQANDQPALHQWSKELWGLAWHSTAKFPGLAYCVGGRSLFWGGWSPQLLDAEMPDGVWPAAVKGDLQTRFFREASEQIGVTETNDFIVGELQTALRQRLFDAVTGNKVTGAIPLAEVPSHLDGVPVGQEDISKLEAPLAVQCRTRPGAFPINKFSAVPLLVKAARSAALESNGDDVKKRLMVVPNCHVIRLQTSQHVVPVAPAPMKKTETVVTGIETNLGFIPVADGAIVVLAQGTVESTRLAKLSFDRPLIGTNLMAHLRTNYTIRIPRGALGIAPAVKDLQAGAVFLKGRVKHADNSFGHFHLQITATGLDRPGAAADSEAELFRKIPDVDTLRALARADDNFVVVTIRGIGEMEPHNANSFVGLDSQADEFGAARAFVSVTMSAGKDQTVLAAMKKATQDVAAAFADGGTMVVLEDRTDGLGTTHHETGSLWMGDDPTTSVTDSDGRFHHTANAYAAGPSIFPTIGSPNPMLTGIALVRRLARKLVPDVPAATAEPGFTPLFNGFSLAGWTMAGSGGFNIVDGALESFNGTSELGLLWHQKPSPADFTLRLEWRTFNPTDNSGVFVRFPDPDSKGYVNTAWVGVDFGFEVQIDESGPTSITRTGAIYQEPTQVRNELPANPPGNWNAFEIQVQGQHYTVKLNGVLVSDFTNPHAGRGVAGTIKKPSYLGLQTYPGKRVQFRNIRIS